MLPLRQLATALANTTLVSAHGPWSRAIGYRYLLGPPPGLTGPPQPLWGGAAKLAGARFTPQGGFDSIYLAHDSRSARQPLPAPRALTPVGMNPESRTYPAPSAFPSPRPLTPVLL
jgi:hypothetical protein